MKVGSRKEAWHEFLAFSRYHEWNPGKMSFLVGFLLFLELKREGTVLLPAFLLWYAAFALFLAFSYMLNNVSDLAVDQAAGKNLALARWTAQRKLVATCVVGLLGFSIAAVNADTLTLVPLSICYLLGWAYSFPPRLKENLILGPVVASVGQLVAPAVTVLVSYRIYPPSVTCYLAVMLFFGLRMILLHQVLDRENDAATGVLTTATRLGAKTTSRLISTLFLFELVALAWMLRSLQGDIAFGAILLLLSVPLLHVGARWFHGMPTTLETYEYIPLVELYESFLPLVLAFSLSVRSGMRLYWAPAIVICMFASRHFERISGVFYAIKGPKPGAVCSERN